MLNIAAAFEHHALSEVEQADIRRDGYVVVRGALSDRVVEDLRSIAFARDSHYRAAPEVGRHHVLNEHDLVGDEPAWFELIDNPTVFAKVVAIMGWNIQLFHTQLLVTPPAPDGAQPGPYGWHQDNNRMNRDLDTALHPMVSLKVGYFLTPLRTTGMGNLCVVPGSHVYARPSNAVGDGWRGSAGWPHEQPPEWIEVLAEAGDAVIFDRRLWHSASTNTSSTTRVFVTYGYSYRWLRPKSSMDPAKLPATDDPLRRQLLGWATGANGYYDPTALDVPLREWMREHLDDADVPR